MTESQPHDPMDYQQAKRHFEQGMKALANTLPDEQRIGYNRVIFETREDIPEPKETAEAKMYAAVQALWPECRGLCDYQWFIDQLVIYHPAIPAPNSVKYPDLLRAVADVIDAKLTKIEIEAMAEGRT